MSKVIVQKATVRTNPIKDSVCRLDVEPVKFSDLWGYYPTKPPYVDPKTGKPPPGFTNQCAIKVSVAIHGAGIEMKSFTAKVIGANPKDFGLIKINGKNTATLASQLAQWLKKQPFCGLPQQPENITGEDWEKNIKGRTGIVYFADYWQRQGESETTRSGDHIDLWNESRLTHNIANFARRLGINSVRWLPTVGSLDINFSDLAGSKTILFWEVK